MHRWAGSVLYCVEVGTVLAIAGTLLLAGGYFTLSVIFGVGVWDWPARLALLHRAVRAINENWRAGLLLLIPLFYRPLSTFLEQVEKMGPLTRPRPRPPEQVQPGENPPAERR